MRAADVAADLSEVLYTEEQLKARLAELCREIEADYAGRNLLLVGVLKGAVMVMADLSREFTGHIQMDWMAVSSYGAGTKSSGVVRIVKDLDVDLHGRDVLIVEDIIDTGLTLQWLRENLETRGPASVEICALFRKAGGREGGRGCALRRLRHPQRLRRRLRPRLCRAVPQSPRSRDPCAPRLLLSTVMSTPLTVMAQPQANTREFHVVLR